MVAILKALIYTAEEYIGEIKEVKLECKKPEYQYSHDRVLISGVMEDGRGFKLELELEDAVQ